MITIEMLRQKIESAGRELEEAVDMSIELRRQSPTVKAEVVKIWEEFLGSFFSYIKQKSKESKDNLLAGISWTRLKLF
ncbi:Hypothetical protein LUCI_0291 [Lucifera butyrica]|uniref:Uncharacterized protein n=1 Tax=Lucifera butyrica TaxID=1351585 RepID=A0A498R1P3_9FIRM|nr:hypothetical protein [Lucifera butyrica]VBB05085.1 Hypothetical protein LUCI_0291 [Lucifera butyrica]